MRSFIARISPAVKWFLNGFDRIVFKGGFPAFWNEANVPVWLERNNVLNKDFKTWMMAQTKTIVQRAEQMAENHTGEPIVRFRSAARKEEVAHRHQRERDIDSGLIGVYWALENCQSFKAFFDPNATRPAIRRLPTKCKHLYFYFDHPVFGFMSVRLQTWFPYSIQIQLNGREWLRRGLEREGIDFTRMGNKFLQIEDWGRAQSLLDQQVGCLWPKILDQFAKEVFPDKTAIIGAQPDYYWTLWQSEWASDLIFDDTAGLDAIGRDLIRHAFMIASPERVFRYLDRPLTRREKIDLRCKDEVHSSIINFSDDHCSGYRVRHYAGKNSVKVYSEKNVLRVETTINNPGAFKINRHKQGEATGGAKQRLPMRKGVADTAARAVVSQEVNKRVIEDLATLRSDQPLCELLDTVCRAKHVKGRRVRALDPTGKDRAVLSSLFDPACALSGINNRLIRERLVACAAAGGRSEKQLSAYVSRQIRLLRDHGLLRKLPKQNSYHLTPRGRKLITSFNAVYNASITELMEIAA